nr:MAG TPA: hypothetical protein [Caudoviricetes sp.]DAU82239.1 MAG TPA: hypothetical protein [Caudoviricetes sp.]
MLGTVGSQADCKEAYYENGEFVMTIQNTLQHGGIDDPY